MRYTTVLDKNPAAALDYPQVSHTISPMFVAPGTFYHYFALIYIYKNWLIRLDI